MVSKSEFKQTSAELFKSGNALTSEQMATFAENIANLETSAVGGGIQSITTDERTRENKRVKIEKTDDGVKINTGPWFNRYQNEFIGLMIPSVSALQQPRQFPNSSVDFEYIKNYGLPVGGAGVSFTPDGKQVRAYGGDVYRMLLNGARMLYSVNWGNAATRTYDVINKKYLSTDPYSDRSTRDDFIVSANDVWTIQSIEYFLVLKHSTMTDDGMATRDYTITCAVMTGRPIQYDDTMEIGMGYDLNLQSVIIEDKGFLTPSDSNKYSHLITTIKY